jgi:hypothetical protein
LETKGKRISALEWTSGRVLEDRAVGGEGGGVNYVYRLSEFTNGYLWELGYYLTKGTGR